MLAMDEVRCAVQKAERVFLVRSLNNCICTLTNCYPQSFSPSLSSS